MKVALPDAIPARPVTMPKIVEGSTAVTCARCGFPVWATPLAVKAGLAERLVCPSCSPKHGVEQK
jgi:hypothetical protein